MIKQWILTKSEVYDLVSFLFYANGASTLQMELVSAYDVVEVAEFRVYRWRHPVGAGAQQKPE